MRAGWAKRPGNDSCYVGRDCNSRRDYFGSDCFPGILTQRETFNFRDSTRNEDSPAPAIPSPKRTSLVFGSSPNSGKRALERDELSEAASDLSSILRVLVAVGMVALKCGRVLIRASFRPHWRR